MPMNLRQKPERAKRIGTNEYPLDLCKAISDRDCEATMAISRRTVGVALLKLQKRIEAGIDKGRGKTRLASRRAYPGTVKDCVFTVQTRAVDKAIKYDMRRILLCIEQPLLKGTCAE